MIEGTLIDTGYGQSFVSGWQPGKAVFSRWLGLKVRTKDVVRTTSFRCSRCYYLEIFAPPVDR